MARGRDKVQWNHTSSVLAMLLNTRLGKKGRLAKPSQFNPYLKQTKGMPVTKGMIKHLAAAMGAENVTVSATREVACSG